MTKYEYDEHANLKRRVSPEAGDDRYYYDKFGRLRFYIHRKSSGPWDVVYSGYDGFNRILYKGVYPVSSQTAVDNCFYADSVYNTAKTCSGVAIEAFEDRNWNTYMLTINMYDTLSRTGVFGSLPSEYDNLAAEYRNYKGRLAATAFRDKAGDPWSYKVYIYDALGRVLFFDVKYGNLPWKRIKNEYDAADNMVKQSFYYDKNTGHNQNFYRWFDYDDEGRLSELRSSMSDAKSTARLDKRYLYNNADQIDTSRFTGLTSPLWQKYGYDNRGRINSQAGTGKMEMELRYHHNSNISETYFSYDGTTGLPQSEIEYSYDGLNRLTAATEKREQAFSEEYSYDPDGNILTKIRSNPGNGTFKEMYYNYETGTNRLDWLAIADDNMGYYEANYSTDSRGNITADEYRSSSNFIYDHRNLPLQLSANGATVKYSYDDNGNRIYKEFGSTKEFYLRDHSGQELAVFKISGSTDTLQFYNLHGSGLEGKVEPNYTWNYETEPPQIERSDEPYYYIKDHLGTIRVTINKQGTVIFAADYWPYGEKMAEYNAGGNTGQRYIFTEKERDIETGYDYFGARFYDSDLGRWMTVDPLMDKYPGWSPYNYVMENPLRLVDPDGKEVRLNNRKDAEKLVKEINKVLGGEHVFVVEIKIYDGDNNQLYFRIDANESSLDWGADKYLSAAYDVFASSEQIFTVVYSENYQGNSYSTMKGLNISHKFGGGIFDVSEKAIWLSSNGQFKNGSEGTVFFHEVLGHGHPVGRNNATEVSARFGGKYESHWGGYRQKVGWDSNQLNLWQKRNK